MDNLSTERTIDVQLKERHTADNSAIYVTIPISRAILGLENGEYEKCALSVDELRCFLANQYLN